MTRKTIVLGGNAAYQLPAALVSAVPSTPIDGGAAKVLSWLLWEAHSNSRWPKQDDDPAEMLVRYHAVDILAGAGLPHRDYQRLRDAFRQLLNLRCHGFPDAFVLDVTELPGPHFEVCFSAFLAECNCHPLAQYALLSMDHIRKLGTTLEVALYARACQVARQKRPVFEIGLLDIAWLCNSVQAISWRTLRRHVLQSLSRICAATGARVVMQGWCCGDFHGVDRLRCHVGLEGETRMPRFPPRHGALYFDIGPNGWRRIVPSVAAKEQQPPRTAAR